MELRRLGFGCLDISQERLSPARLPIEGHASGIDQQAALAIDFAPIARNQKMGISGLPSAVDFSARDAFEALHLVRWEPGGFGNGGGYLGGFHLCA
jgi:hypothetical protein